MNEENIEKIIREFYESGEENYEKYFRVKGKPKYIFNIKIEREERENLEKSSVYDSISNEAFISALPSGTDCPRCGGSGRA